MMLGTKGRYAVMAMVDMAAYYEKAIPVRLTEISKRQDISINYLEQIFLKLRKSNLVLSQRGPGGGYILARSPDSIFISEVISAVGESIKITRCDGIENEGCMKGGKRCLTHDLWESMGKRIIAYIQEVSLKMWLIGRYNKGLIINDWFFSDNLPRCKCNDTYE